MTRAFPPAGPAPLKSYADVLKFLADGVKPQGRRAKASPELTFIRNVEGVDTLYRTISAVGAAVPGTSEEEWNPLSQRPHSPHPPEPSHELGEEIFALKAAVDSFTTLAHEMMHVALWEPYFTGRWRPTGTKAFTGFSLLGEGYSFFFSDIIVSRAVRARMPDGEYALERHTSENARFHPIRAFDALGIKDDDRILDVYLDAFCGRKTKLWQPRGTSAYASSLAGQIHDFYEGALLALHELHGAIAAFGGTSELHERFCRIPNLPTFLGVDHDLTPESRNLKDYFLAFHAKALDHLVNLDDLTVGRIRLRRALQMRAYFALQLRWVLTHDLVVAKSWSASKRKTASHGVDSYLDGLEALLFDLARSEGNAVATGLASLDDSYDASVRQSLIRHDAWVASRWLVVPRRAGGFVSIKGPTPAKDRDAKIALLRTTAFLVDELTRRMRASKTIEERAAIMTQIRRVSALGELGSGSAKATQQALMRLRRELIRPEIRDIWSLPLASIDPARNAFRELAFSYK